MNERAKLLKIIACTNSSLLLLTFIIILIISGKDRFTILPYMTLIISIVPCASLWKMYLDEKKQNVK